MGRFEIKLAIIVLTLFLTWAVNILLGVFVFIVAANMMQRAEQPAAPAHSGVHPLHRADIQPPATNGRMSIPVILMGLTVIVLVVGAPLGAGVLVAVGLLMFHVYMFIWLRK